MCVYSTILDHFEPIFPFPVNPVPEAPAHAPVTATPLWPWSPQIDLSELRKLIADFTAAMAAAKTVDRIVGHPDCESAEKAKLVARVAELERMVKALAALAIGDRVTLTDEGTVRKISAMPGGEALAVLVERDSNGDAEWCAPAMLRRVEK